MGRGRKVKKTAFHPLIAGALEQIELDREPHRSFIVVSFELAVQRFKTHQQALRALDRLPSERRGALVDLKTGKTWVTRSRYGQVRSFLRRWGLAPRRFRRVGRIGVPRHALASLKRELGGAPATSGREDVDETAP